MPGLIKITAEQAVIKLLNRQWFYREGHWQPSITADPTIIPGNYTLPEALALYGYCVEDD